MLLNEENYSTHGLTQICYSVPAGAVCIAVIGLVFPKRFPYHCDPGTQTFHPGYLKKIDVLGAVFLLAATTLLVTALSEGEVRFAWDSATIIAFFTVSGVLWLVFLLWEWYVSRHSSTQIEPLFPWRFFRNRVWMGLLMCVIILQWHWDD